MSIAIATPASTIFHEATAVERERILALSGALEVRDDRPIEVKSVLPRICHCELSIVEPWTDEALESIASLLRSGSMRYVSLHVHACYRHPAKAGGVFVPTGERMSEEEMLATAAENVRRLKMAVGDIMVAVENNNYFAGGAYESVTEPQFLRRLMDATGAQLLLDIAHAEITAKHTGTTLEAYLGALPLEKVVQIHLSGPTRTPEKYLDSHLALGDTEWEQYAMIAPRCPNLRYVTIEYYRDPALLIGMLETLKQRI